MLAIVWGYFGLMRFEGTTGSFASEFQYRWTPTAEERFTVVFRLRDFFSKRATARLNVRVYRGRLFRQADDVLQGEAAREHREQCKKCHQRAGRLWDVYTLQ